MDTANPRPDKNNSAVLQSILILCASACLALSACGGGGGAPPAPDYPDPVEEITEDDLLAAGIPALPLAASSVHSASHSGSLSIDCQRTETVGKNETITIAGLVETLTGFETEVEEDTTSRIIAWAMWELPALTDERIRSLVLNVSADPQLRVFFAVGNFSRGRWEPVGRVGSGLLDGTSNTIMLSPGQRYNRADGPGYLLMLVGHPGDGNERRPDQAECACLLSAQLPGRGHRQDLGAVD
jgi:hypothetical protein